MQTERQDKVEGGDKFRTGLTVFLVMVGKCQGVQWLDHMLECV